MGEYYSVTATKRIVDLPDIIILGNRSKPERWFIELGVSAYTTGVTQLPPPQTVDDVLAFALSLKHQYEQVDIKKLSKAQAERERKARLLELTDVINATSSRR